jgi:protein disulfide-isomerase
MRVATLTLTTLVTAALALPASAQAGSWLTSFEDAKTAAKKDQKVILANFTGSDWCGWCIKLKDEVFSQPEFQQWADQKVVLLELDFPRKTEISAELKEQNTKLAKQFGIRGYPTIVLLDADGKQLGQLGYKKGGPKAWIEAAEAQMAPKPDGGEWLTDYKQALERAKKEKKVVLADFTGSDWCGWCIKLKDEVFSKPEFQQWAQEHVVLLELDFPKNKPQSEELKQQNEKLRDEFGIQGYPTILFLDAKGKKVGQSGYVEGGPEKWIEAAEKELGIKGKKKSKKAK